MTKPRLLDLFSGAGGASMGYARAGFDVVGVDIEPQPNYPFKFVNDDALEVADWLRRGYNAANLRLQEFDAIHASPPCQAFSVATRDKTGHPNLIEPVRELLSDSGLPYVIENVPGAPLHNPVILCGSSFGLRVRRHRLFETNWPLLVPPCNHHDQGQPVGVYGEGTGTGQVRGRKVMSSAEALEVMEMPWADRKGATQAIPPMYTHFIGLQLQAYLERRNRLVHAVDCDLDEDCTCGVVAVPAVTGCGREDPVRADEA